MFALTTLLYPFNGLDFARESTLSIRARRPLFLCRWELQWLYEGVRKTKGDWMEKKIVGAVEAVEHIGRVFSSLGNFDDLTTDKQRIIWVVWWFYCLVGNGGAEAFFDNDVADHTTLLIDGLERIGAPLTLQCLRKWCQLFPGGLPDPSHHVRQMQIKEIEARTRRKHPWRAPELGCCGFWPDRIEFDGQEENLFGLLLWWSQNN
jgi:Domain of unknown function (DUF4375)